MLKTPPQTFSFSALFQHADCDFLAFDLSRRVSLITHDEFISIEKNHQPYPYPIQAKALIAIAYWKKNQAKQTEPLIWFLSFKLDERGLLNQIALGDFIQDVLQKGLFSQDEKKQESKSKSPYLFTPTEDKKAIFHAKLTQALSLPASGFYSATNAYLANLLNAEFSGKNLSENKDEENQAWQQIGLQGLADVCARADDGQSQALIQKTLPKLAMPVKYALLGCLEHFRLSAQLTSLIMQEIKTELKAPKIDLFLLSAYVRALGGAAQETKVSILNQLLNNAFVCHKELLIAMSGRCWEGLGNQENLTLFLVRLSEQKDLPFFQLMLADLIMLPSIRPLVLTLLNQKTSPELEAALAQLS